MVLLIEDSITVEQIGIEGYEKVLHIKDPRVGLEAIISIHCTRLGPALGGVRIYPYASFDDALTDVLRLSKAMTYKSAVSECKTGGGKSVIIASQEQKTEALLLSFAAVVDSLKGEYIAAEDVGCTPDDMAVMAKVTPFVVGLAQEKSSGNPSPFTAWGTYRGIQALLKRLYGSEDVEGRSIAVQGVGSVGSKLVEFLFWSGAKLYLADINEQKAKQLCEKYGATFVSNSQIHKVECDIFSPCALGAVINSHTIPELRCRAIGGSANNQLMQETDGDELKRRGILYAPDFVINAGGLINVATEIEVGGYNPSLSQKKVHHLYNLLITIFEIAERNGSSTNNAAISLAEYRREYKIGRRDEPVEFPLAKK